MLDFYLLIVYIIKNKKLFGVHIDDNVVGSAAGDR